MPDDYMYVTIVTLSDYAYCVNSICERSDELYVYLKGEDMNE